MKFELHPLCALFPRMTGNEFEALKSDIATNGLRQPIITHNGMILDGGNRYEACLAAGVKPTMLEYKGENLVTYVMSANFHRRHLSHGQQAAIVASATDWANAQTHGGDRKVDQETLASLATVKSRAALSGAGTTAQKQADKLAREKPELAKQVAKGEKSLYQAVKENDHEAASIHGEQIKPAIRTVERNGKTYEQDTANIGKALQAPAASSSEVAKSDDDDPIAILSDENDRLNDRLAVVAMDATPEERAAAADTIEDLRTQVKTLTATLAAVTASRDSYMRENVELKRQCAGYKRQLDKIKKG